MKLPDEHLLTPELLAATFLSAGHLDRATARANAYSASPDIGAAFDRACEAQDTVQFTAHEILPPAGLTSRLLLLPTAVLPHTDTPAAQSAPSDAATISDPTTALTDRLLAFPDAGIAPARRVFVSTRLVAAVLFATLTGAVALWQVGVLDWATQPSIRERITTVATAAAQVDPSKAVVKLPATQPATAIARLRQHSMSAENCQAEDLPILVLEPAPGYVLETVGVTRLANHPARFATYVHNHQRYTLYQISTAAAGLPINFSPYDAFSQGQHIKVWPSVTNACTWVLVSADPVAINTQDSGY